MAVSKLRRVQKELLIQQRVTEMLTADKPYRGFSKRKLRSLAKQYVSCKANGVQHGN